MLSCASPHRPTPLGLRGCLLRPRRRSCSWGSVCCGQSCPLSPQSTPHARAAHPPALCRPGDPPPSAACPPLTSSSLAIIRKLFGVGGRRVVIPRRSTNVSRRLAPAACGRTPLCPLPDRRAAVSVSQGGRVGCTQCGHLGRQGAGQSRAAVKVRGRRGGDPPDAAQVSHRSRDRRGPRTPHACCAHTHRVPPAPECSGHPNLRPAP